MLTLSAWESSISLVLLGLSLYLFWRRFGAVLRVIRASKPDADFRLKPLAPRLREFVLEVLLQRQVIRERRLAGVAHALVFWGFCAFALVTLDHLAVAFRLDPISAAGSLGRTYLNVVAWFAIAVAAAIAGLAVRRFVVRPKWLGEVSPESGLIAFLIFLLMVTYLASLWLGEEGLGARVNWWLHTLALLVFLPLIPHTKHLHLVLSPFAVFFRREGFSQIPPLAEDDDFGLVAGKDVTRVVALQSFSCVECGRCTEHCPAHLTGKVLNPKEVILGMRSYLREAGPGSEQPLLEKHLSPEAVFQCTTCGACEYQCPLGIQHLPVIVGLRRGAVNTGTWEDDYGTRLFLNLERYGNPLGLPSPERDKFIARAELPFYDGSQEYCLWLGCMGAYDPQGRDIVVALTAILRHLGVSFGVLRKESCTGDSARRLGNDLLFGQLAESNHGQIRAAGVKRMLSICPHCVRTIGTDWREYGAAVAIEHHTEFLERHRDRLPGTRTNGKTAVYHDPCYLGRYRGVYQAPRRVLEAGLRVLEPPRSGARSFCCGAGGGLTFLGEEKGKRVSAERAEELAATGADIVAAACPFCHTMFRDALAAVSASPPQLLDVAQIVAAGLDS